MNKLYLAVGTFTFASFFLFSCDKAGAISGKEKAIVTSQDSISYIIGTDIGHSLLPLKGEINLDLIYQGIHDRVDSAEIKISREKMNEIMQAFNTKMRTKMDTEAKDKNDKNVAEGKKFLEENKTKQGVITTASGLQYIVMKEGKGPKPVATDKVKVNYKGTLLDGTEFDSSYKNGQPVEFQLNTVIPGWTEGLQLMTVGSKYKFFVPSNLGYGERSPGPLIGANAVLVFEVELLGIIK
jgi:FKBP-type peptidyl-prolyl cis-trans isomerase FkpA